MTKQTFINIYKEEIDAYIKAHVPNAVIDDSERWLWIVNDEKLYNLAVAEGVNL